MRLLDLIKQNDRIRAASHRFRQHATLAVANVSRRRPLQRGDGMRFLKFRHIDRDQMVLTTIEQIGERQRGLGFADAAWANKHKDADRLTGIVHASARGHDALPDCIQGMHLADNPLAEILVRVQHR